MRRKFSDAQKINLLAEYEATDDRQAFLKKHGLRYGMVSNWRKKFGHLKEVSLESEPDIVLKEITKHPKSRMSVDDVLVFLKSKIHALQEVVRDIEGLQAL